MKNLKNLIKKEYEIKVDKKAIKQNSIALMKGVKTILDKHSMTFWIDQGTLLGAIRDNNFMPWDWDIDFSAWMSEFNQKSKIWNEFRKRGYYVFFLNRSQTVRLERKEPSVGWRHVDMHFYDIEGDTAISYFGIFKKNTLERILFKLMDFIAMVQELKNGPNLSSKAIAEHLIKVSGDKCNITIPGITSGFSWFSLGIGKILSLMTPTSLLVSAKDLLYKIRFNLCTNLLTLKTPYRYFRNFEEKEFLEDSYRIPNNVEEYLRFKYGKDWRVPREKYDFVREDGSLKHADTGFSYS